MTPSRKARPSPFYEATVAEGMTSAGLYNRMIMPISYGDRHAEYWRLVNGVAQWDVGVERQLQLKGRDAGRLAQILSVRDLSDCRVGQGKYVPFCDHRGSLINDPVMLKLDDDLYWFSIADADMWTWASAIAGERGLTVEVSEPDVSPMALQGPKAEDVVAAVCGDEVRALRYFCFRESAIEGIPVVIQRSGWSKQGGFEIYLRDGSQGSRLWQIFKEAGRPWDIGPGAPATAERIESGLLNCGADTDPDTNPFEVCLGKYVDLTLPDEVIGVAALRRLHKEGIKRHLLGVLLDDPAVAKSGFRPVDVFARGTPVGSLRCWDWSPRMERTIGFVLIASTVRVGEVVKAMIDGSPVEGRLVELPFM